MYADSVRNFSPMVSARVLASHTVLATAAISLAACAPTTPQLVTASAAAAASPAPLPAPPAPTMAGQAGAPPPGAKPEAEARPESLTCFDRTGRRWNEPVPSPATLVVPNASQPPSSGKINTAGRVLAGARGTVRACFQAVLNEDPSVTGTMTFTLHVVADGVVEHACVGPTGTIAQTAAVPCVGEALVALRFAPPEQPENAPPASRRATVTGSFSFTNTGRARENTGTSGADQPRAM